MASAMYPKGLINLMKGNCPLDTVAVNAALVDIGTYVYDATHELYGEITGVQGTPGALASKTLGVVGSGVFDAADITFTAVTGTSIGAVILYMDGATKYLLCYAELASQVPLNGCDIIIQWDDLGIFTI